MSRKKNKTGSDVESSAKDAPESSTSAKPSWDDSTVKTQRREFPVSDETSEPLRISVSGEAYSQMQAHAKDHLEEEVCGVLIGTLCEDENGRWVDAQAAIEGTTTKQGGTHVTYTQETWEAIYAIKDKKYPKLNIVGWYHTHPGFGVQFSDMDKFIQNNFFSGPGQFALVIDPLSGDEAICANVDGGLQDIGTFWVAARPRTCWTPPQQDTDQGESDTTSSGVASSVVLKSLEDIEKRLGQVLQATDDERNRNGCFLTGVGSLVALAAVAMIAFSALQHFSGPQLAEKYRTYPGFVKIDGKTVVMGVDVGSIEVPDSMMDERMAEIQKQIQETINAQREEIQRLQAMLAAKESGAEPITEKPAPNSWPILVLGSLIAVAIVMSLTYVVRGLRRGSRQKK